MFVRAYKKSTASVARERKLTGSSGPSEYERPTAEHQQKQIADSSKFLVQFRRGYIESVVLTDYQLQGFAPLVANLWRNIHLT